MPSPCEGLKLDLIRACAISTSVTATHHTLTTQACHGLPPKEFCSFPQSISATSRLRKMWFWQWAPGLLIPGVQGTHQCCWYKDSRTQPVLPALGSCKTSIGQTIAMRNRNLMKILGFVHLKFELRPRNCPIKSFVHHTPSIRGIFSFNVW